MPRTYAILLRDRGRLEGFGIEHNDKRGLRQERSQTLQMSLCIGTIAKSPDNDPLQIGKQANNDPRMETSAIRDRARCHSSIVIWHDLAIKGHSDCTMNLRALRERAGLTILDVAKELQCAESSIRNWEKGRTTPKMEVWQAFRLRDLYQCTETELEKAIAASMKNEP